MLSTVTLGKDDTAIVENIDAENYEKFTLVENIKGSVAGYTFKPCENIVIEMKSLSANNELNVNVVNKVTSETANSSEKSDHPETGDRTNMGRYIVVMIAGAISIICVRIEINSNFFILEDY